MDSSGGRKKMFILCILSLWIFYPLNGTPVSPVPHISFPSVSAILGILCLCLFYILYPVPVSPLSPVSCHNASSIPRKLYKVSSSIPRILSLCVNFYLLYHVPCRVCSLFFYCPSISSIPCILPLCLLYPPYPVPMSSIPRILSLCLSIPFILSLRLLYLPYPVPKSPLSPVLCPCVSSISPASCFYVYFIPRILSL